MDIKEYKNNIEFAKNIISKTLKVYPKYKILHEEILATKTTIACYTPTNDTINIKYLENIDKVTLLFVLFHEARHCYQYKNRLINVENYMKSSETTLNDYNAQKVEIDAHAYAYFILKQYFNVEILFESLDIKTKQKIITRVDTISKEIE